MFARVVDLLSPSMLYDALDEERDNLEDILRGSDYDPDATDPDMTCQDEDDGDQAQRQYLVEERPELYWGLIMTREWPPAIVAGSGAPVIALAHQLVPLFERWMA